MEAGTDPPIIRNPKLSIGCYCNHIFNDRTAHVVAASELSDETVCTQSHSPQGASLIDNEKPVNVQRSATDTDLNCRLQPNALIEFRFRDECLN